MNALAPIPGPNGEQYARPTPSSTPTGSPIEAQKQWMAETVSGVTKLPFNAWMEQRMQQQSNVPNHLVAY